MLHIDLRKWADIAIIAPLDANTLAKVRAHFCMTIFSITLQRNATLTHLVALDPLGLIIILFIKIFFYSEVFSMNYFVLLSE